MRQLKIQKSITNRTSEALDKYLVEIGRAPLISIDEEIELAQTIRHGGRAADKAKEKLVSANLRFVVSVAKQYQHQGLSLTDLIDEGKWIRQSILQAIAEQSRIVRLPLNQTGALSKINQTINTFEQEHGRRPSNIELEELTGVESDKIEQAIKADAHHMSIDAPFGDDDDNTMSDLLSSGDESRTDKQVDYQSLTSDLDTVLRRVLKDRELRIVKECFGIGCQEKGLEEIGTEMGLTRERVRQIREKSIAKLRDSGYAKMLMKYLG